MFKRVVWFSVGAVTGASASVYGYVLLREARGRLAPDRVADTLVGIARSVGSGVRSVGGATRSAGGTVGTSVREALSEGREAMADAEARIAADLDARPTEFRRRRDQ
jgi:hypothetical protein